MSIEHSPARVGVRILRRRQLLQKLGISSTTLWQWVRDGKFPSPFDLAPGVPAWLEDTVDQHLLGLADAAKQHQPEGNKNTTNKE